MGFRSTWLGVRGLELGRVLEVLDWEPTGAEEGLMETGLWAVRRGAWVVVCASGWEYMTLLAEEHGASLSKEAPALFWQGDDSSMVSSLVAYESGQETWSLFYDGQNGVSSPEVSEGEPEAVRLAVAQQQELQDDAESDVDYLYESAHVAGDLLTGFRHDEGEPPDGEPLYLQLRPRTDPPGAKRSFRTLECSTRVAGVTLRVSGSDAYGLRATLTSEAAVEEVTLRQVDRNAEGGIASIREFAEGLTLAQGESKSWWAAREGAGTTWMLSVAGKAGEVSFEDQAKESAKKKAAWWRFWE